MSDATQRLRLRRERMFLRHLLRLTLAMSEETTRRMNDRGHPDILPSHPRFLGNLDTDGTRLGALARRMRMTRQAVSQQLPDLERRGFVARRPDPEDRRGVIIVFTPQGRRMLETAVEVMTEIEAEYARLLGARTFATLKRDLQRLVEAVDGLGALGLD